jgi:hypothetical protein
MTTMIGWGGNNGGTVGDGTIVTRCSPVLVTSGRGVLANANIFMIGAGFNAYTRRKWCDCILGLQYRLAAW